jgi:hypothetical protein
MSNSETEPDTGIDDEQLPDDLQPSEDNPLADGLEEDERVDDLLAEGKGDDSDESDDENDD